ncbi:hypothetical protein MPSI1_001366 [Malassezia psittaci]|uniref:Peptidase A1 domain-containing protein n=1 Tax=Malassezia psittaci TaxID=1821823 RepID=A0AAF0JD87_9BASI|nr:hypothetical protein MPSI1_001366 [Malassezia psittaci]
MQITTAFLSLVLLATSSISASPANVKYEEGLPITLARRAAFVNDDQEVDLDALSKHHRSLEQKYAKILDTYQKNTGHTHPLQKEKKSNQSQHMKRSSEEGQDGSLPLDNSEHATIWAGNVTFGGQTISVDFDTATVDTVVDHAAYDPSKSKTSKNTHKKFNENYGVGTSTDGIIYTDTAKIGGVKAENVAIGRANNDFFGKGHEPARGLCGLAFNSLQSFPSEYPPLFDALRKQHAVKQGVFQFTLKPKGDSSLQVGGLDKSKAKNGDFEWTKVKSSMGFWLIDATINDKPVTGIVDSSTTLIIGPDHEIEEVLKPIKGLTPKKKDGGTAYLYECDQEVKVTIQLGGVKFDLPKELVNYGKVDGKCMLPIMSETYMPLDSWLLGDTVFQMTTLAFDMDKKRLGVALQA